jgi:hypothetical protein
MAVPFLNKMRVKKYGFVPLIVKKLPAKAAEAAK